LELSEHADVDLGQAGSRRLPRAHLTCMLRLESLREKCKTDKLLATVDDLEELDQTLPPSTRLAISGRALPL
jgi:hypothetical protein